MNSDFRARQRTTQPRTFACTGCGVRHPFTAIGTGVCNELMDIGEAAPICGPCTARAATSSDFRHQVEREVRRLSQEPGGVPDRIVLLDPDWLAQWGRR